MRVCGFGRYALTSSVGLVLLAGCGGTQSPVAMPILIPQGRAVAPAVDRAASWMLPEAKSENLLYISEYDKHPFVQVYSYPKGKPVGTLNGVRGLLCSDAQGDVWMPNFGHAIVEYAHGGNQPIATLKVPYPAIGCAIDPRSGDLAVTLRAKAFAIYRGAKGTARVYKAPYAQYCGYDNEGNLFTVGLGQKGSSRPVLHELRKGANTTRTVSFASSEGFPSFYPERVQWDGHYVTLGTPVGIARYVVRNYRATSEGVTWFKDVHLVASTWIQGSKVIVTNMGGSGDIPALQIVKYPAGGEPVRIFKKGEILGDVGGMTVSLAPNKR